MHGWLEAGPARKKSGEGRGFTATATELKGENDKLASSVCTALLSELVQVRPRQSSSWADLQTNRIFFTPLHTFCLRLRP